MHYLTAKILSSKDDKIILEFSKLKAKKIEAVSGFTGLYKITTKKNIIYCNKDLNKCFEVKKWIKK